MSGLTGLPNFPGIAELLKRAREMGAQLKETRERLRNERYSASVGGDLVKVTVNGECDVLQVEIDPSLVDSSGKEMLEDLVAAAVNQAAKKAREASREAMAKVTGGVDVSGLLGLS